ncbi:MAG: acyl carrier protein [Bacteroidota bacterium]
MDKQAVLQALNEIYVDVLDNEEIVLSPETVAADIEEWDSLSHIQLIVSVEKHFKLQFKTQEVQEFANVGSICDAILVRVNAELG